MSAPWKRDDWNAIVRSINDLIDNGCADAEPLEEVPVNHIWTVGDITTVRDKLTEICSASFGAATTKWSQTIIDEINAAIENCDCETKCPNNQTKNVYCGSWQPPNSSLDDILKKCNDYETWKEVNAADQAAVDAARTNLTSEANTLVETARDLGGDSAAASTYIALYGESTGDDDIEEILSDLLADEPDSPEWIDYSGCEAWGYLLQTIGNEPLYALGNRLDNAEPDEVNKAAGEYATALDAYNMCFHGANPDGAYYLRGADGSLQGVVSRGSQGYTKNGEYKTAYRNYELAKNDYDDAREQQRQHKEEIDQEVRQCLIDQGYDPDDPNLGLTPTPVDSSAADQLARALKDTSASYRKALLASFTARRTAETLEAEGAKSSAIQDAIATQTEKESEAQSMLEQVNGLFEQWQEAASAVETDETSLLFYPLLSDVPQAWDALYTYDNFLKGLGLNCQPSGEFTASVANAVCEWTPTGEGFCLPAAIAMQANGTDSAIDINLTITHSV